MKSGQEYEFCAQRLKALGEPERLRIVQLLFAGESNVSDLAEELKDDIVKVSHHLGVLRHAGLVTTRKDGRFVIYALHPDVFAAAKVVGDKRRLDLGCCKLEIPLA